VGAIKATWIGAFAIALVAPASAGWALPNPPALAPAVAAATGPLLLIRHHHGHWRHRHSRWPGDDEPEAAAPGTDQPGAAASPPVTAARAAADRAQPRHPRVGLIRAGDPLGRSGKIGPLTGSCRGRQQRGEGRDLFFSVSRADEWVPAFAGT